MRLRVSGLLATAVFLAMAGSDLLMLTSLDFSRPYRGFWAEAPALPHAQVAIGYYLGEFVIPFYCIGAWHLSLAIRPAGAWASWLVLLSMAYAASMLMVWHASFAFARSISLVEIAAGAAPGGPTPDALLAFSTYALPVFRVAIAASAIAVAVVCGLILFGRTLYPRWVGVALPAVFVIVALLLHAYVPVWFAVVLRAAAWNAGGAAAFAFSTAVLWKRDG